MMLKYIIHGGNRNSVSGVNNLRRYTVSIYLNVCSNKANISSNSNRINNSIINNSTSNIIRSNRTSNSNINSMIIRRTLVTESIPSIFSVIQMSLHSIQSTGLPWWATFALSTIIVRSSMFPLIRSQILYTSKLGSAVPEISFLYQLLNKRLQGISIHQTEERLKIINVFIKGIDTYDIDIIITITIIRCYC